MEKVKTVRSGGYEPPALTVKLMARRGCCIDATRTSIAKTAQKGKRFSQKSFGAVGIQLLQHKFVQHGGREQRLLVAKGLPDKNQGHHGLAAGVQPQGVQGVQRLLAGLVQRQVQQKAAVILAAALVGKNIGVAAGVQTVKALIQRKAGAELGQAGGAVLAAAAVFPPGEQIHDDAQRTG